VIPDPDSSAPPSADTSCGVVRAPKGVNFHERLESVTEDVPIDLSLDPRGGEISLDFGRTGSVPARNPVARSRLAQWKNLPLDWTEQHKVLGFT